MKIKRLLIVGIIVLLLTGCISVNSFSYKKEEIKLSHVKNDWYGNDLKYFIDSKEELELFSKYYSDDLDKYRNDLSNSTLFVMLSTQGSGSNKLTLSDVSTENNKLEFIVEKESVKEGEVGTADMAYWYLVALIPNKDLKGIDISDWNPPSKDIR